MRRDQLPRHKTATYVLARCKTVYVSVPNAPSGAAIVIGGQVIDDTRSGLLAPAALVVLLQPRVKVPELALVGAAALVGLLAFG
jgi:hypothetical protein